MIGSFTVGDVRRTHKNFRTWCRTRFPRRLRHRDEIKFSDSNINESLRVRTLQYIANLDVRICYTHLFCENIPEEFRAKASIQSGLLYTHLVGEALELYLPSADKFFYVFCDHRGLKGIKKSDFIKTLTARLLPKLPSGVQIKIEMVDSKKYPNVQIADWVVGAIANFINEKPCGQDYMAILQHNIINSKELFKDYWLDKFDKQKTQSRD